MEDVKKRLAALLQMSAGLIDGLTSVEVTDISNVDGRIDFHVHYKYYTDIDFDLLFRIVNENGQDKLEIHHTSVAFQQVNYLPQFIQQTVMEQQRNELLIEKMKGVLEYLQRGYVYLAKQFLAEKHEIDMQSI